MNLNLAIIIFDSFVGTKESKIIMMVFTSDFKSMEAQVLPAGPPPTMIASYVGMAFIWDHNNTIYFFGPHGIFIIRH